MTTRALRTMIQKALRRSRRVAGDAAVGAGAGGAMAAASRIDESVADLDPAASIAAGAGGMVVARKLARNVARSLGKADRLPGGSKRGLVPGTAAEREAVAKKLGRAGNRARKMRADETGGKYLTNLVKAERLHAGADRLRGKRFSTADRRAELKDVYRERVETQRKMMMSETDRELMRQSDRRLRLMEREHGLDRDIARREDLLEAGRRARTGYADAQSALRQRGRKQS